METKDLMAALDWRYAVRKFKDDVIDETLIQELLTATRLSASSYGLQPYKIIVVNSIQKRKELLPYSYGQDKVVDCSHLIVFAADTNTSDEIVGRYISKCSQVRQIPVEELLDYETSMKQALSSKSAREMNEWAQQQVYIALGNLLTIAAVMKIDTCPMGGFVSEGYDRVLNLKDKNLTATVICAIGKRHPDDKTAYLDKVRYSHDEMVLTV